MLSIRSIPIAVCTFGVLLLTGCGKGENPNPPGGYAVPVAVYQIRPGQATYFDRYPATAVALKQVDIRPQVSGYITSISFKDGQHVRAGTKLYEIEQKQYQASYDQAVANLNIARSNLSKTQQDANRYDSLAKYNAVATQTLQHAHDDLQAAKQQLAAAAANVKNVGTNLEHSVIKAPFDCTIGISQVQIGSEVTAGQTLLNTLSSDNPMAVDCSVDEKQIGRFTQLLHDTTDDHDSTFTLVLPDGSIYPIPGMLSLIDRAIDPVTGTIRARFVFPNPNLALRPGMSCDLRVKSTSPPSSILIPSRSITEQMGEYFVFVVNGNKVSERKVAIGMTVRGRSVIDSGLTAGELIVTDGMQSLKDGSTVSIQSPNTPAHTQSTARQQ